MSRARRLNLYALVSIIFFTVSGGAYGLEPLVGAIGAGWAIVLVILIPMLWSLPIALMVSELSSALPEEGGYYIWVRRALGEFWGFQEGWWTICYTAVDMAIYPVLFVDYLAYFIPALSLDENGAATWQVFGLRWLIAVALISIGLVVNLRGARAVGRNAVWSVTLVLAPFALLIVFAFTRAGAFGTSFHNIGQNLSHRPDTRYLAVGLSIVLWNYFGWDNVSTFAAEVNDPQSTYPRALLKTLSLVIAAYLLPLLAGFAVTVDPNVWNESAGWPVIAEMLGGRGLGAVIAGAALISAWSLYNSQLLYVSRLPYAMALDGWLPSVIARVSKRTSVPVVAVVVSCAFSAIFAALPFGKIVIIDVLMYAAGLSLEFAALIALRCSAPDLPRPFRVPGGWFGVLILTASPMCVAAIVTYSIFSDAGTNPRQLIIAGCMIASGIVIYFLRRAEASHLHNS